MRLSLVFAAIFAAVTSGCSETGNESNGANAPFAADDEGAPRGPWEEPQDAAAAINDPDAYAWRLFVALNWPADAASRLPDTGKKLGADGPVVWETWANARDVFRQDGSDPGAWSTGGAQSQQLGAGRRQSSEFDSVAVQQQIRRAQQGGMTIQFDPMAAANQGNETRLNRATYDFIRTNSLYNLDGLKALAASGKETIQFPLQAKEIKAQWRLITEQEKPRYHWAEVVRPDGSKAIFGLTALHIITKDIPNWFWSTFEHVDNPTRPENEKWLLPSRDTFACKSDPPDCNRSPTGIGLEGTKWENYRLRGTQIDFITSTGKVTLLANSQPEEGFQTTSSCITCHARATRAADGSRLEVFKPNDEGFVGTVDPAWFENGKFTQHDFVWTFIRARPKKENPQ